MFCRRSAHNRTIKPQKMENLKMSIVVLLSIASTILSYPCWLLFTITFFLIPGTESTDLDIYFSILIFIGLIFACRALYRLYNRPENKRKARRAQIGFIFLVSFTIKFFLDGVIIFSEIISSLMILYGSDIFLIAPIAIGVNLAFAKRMQKKRREIARDR